MEDGQKSRTLFVEAENDIQALMRVLDRIAVLQVRCTDIRAAFDGVTLRIVAELQSNSNERLALLVNRISVMPSARSAGQRGLNDRYRTPPDSARRNRRILPTPNDTRAKRSLTSAKRDTPELKASTSASFSAPAARSGEASPLQTLHRGDKSASGSGRSQGRWAGSFSP